jgi:phosphoribosylanthranilate isomerase
MALKGFVTVSGVNNLSDARYCSGMGVNLMGFNIDPAEEDNFTAPERFHAIVGWLSGVEFVGEFNFSTDPAFIAEQASQYQVGYLQVRYGTPLQDLASWKDHLILHIDLNDLQTVDQLGNVMEENKNHCKFFLVTCFHNETSLGNSNLKKVTKLAEKYPVILGFGITRNNVHLLIDDTRISGIGLRGGNEIRPGYKDFDELANILEAIEIDEAID